MRNINYLFKKISLTRNLRSYQKTSKGKVLLDRSNIFIKIQLVKILKRLVALSTIISFAIFSGACVGKTDGQKPNADSQQTQLEILDIDESKALYATPDGAGTKDGLSWENAMDLQAAINAAAADATKEFVLVAQGSYYADLAKDDITKSFELKSGVKIYGGFNPSDMNAARDLKGSILEGKLTASKNTKQILMGNNLSDTTYIDGFLIQNATSADDIKGGGLSLSGNSKPNLIHLTFKENILSHANSEGGAIYIGGTSKPTIAKSVFEGNSAVSGGAIGVNQQAGFIIEKSSFISNKAKYSAAINIMVASASSIDKSVFLSNKASENCGALAIFSEDVAISNSSFLKNHAVKDGGAICVVADSPKSPSIVNSTFIDNKAAGNGGAIFNQYTANTKIYNSILWNNQHKAGGSAYVTNNLFNKDDPGLIAKPEIRNSILNNGSAKVSTPDPNDYSVKIISDYDFMTPSTFASDNLTSDPLFTIGSVTLQASSPAKDKGKNDLYQTVTGKAASEDKDLFNKARLKGSYIDIGASEIQ